MLYFRTFRSRTPSDGARSNILTASLKPPGSPRLETQPFSVSGKAGSYPYAAGSKRGVGACAPTMASGMQRAAVSPKNRDRWRFSGEYDAGKQPAQVCAFAAQAGAKAYASLMSVLMPNLFPGVVDGASRAAAEILLLARDESPQAEALFAGGFPPHPRPAQRGAVVDPILGVGELGMANTTPAAAMVSALSGSDASGGDWRSVTFRLPASIKWDVVRRAIAINSSPIRAMALMPPSGVLSLVVFNGAMLGARQGVAYPYCWMASFLLGAALLRHCRLRLAVRPYSIRCRTFRRKRVLASRISPMWNPIWARRCV